MGRRANHVSIASKLRWRSYGLQMLQRMRRWSPRKRATVLIGAAVASWALSHAVRTLTDSPAATLIANLVVLVLMAWLGITFFRVILRDGEDEARKNPRPW